MRKAGRITCGAVPLSLTTLNDWCLDHQEQGSAHPLKPFPSLVWVSQIPYTHTLKFNRVSPFLDMFSVVNTPIYVLSQMSCSLASLPICCDISFFSLLLFFVRDSKVTFSGKTSNNTTLGP